MPRRFAPRHLIASSHRFISSLVLGCLPFSARLGSCLFPLAPSSMSMPLPSHCFTLPAPPHRHDGRGRYDGAVAVLSALLACPSARHLIRAVRHRMATGLVACLVRLPLPASVSGSSSSVPPATRLLVQSGFLAVLPSCRPIGLIASLPDHSTRGTGRRSLAHLIACPCGSFAIAVRFRLRSICAGFVYCGGGGCLACLGVVLFILSMGDVVARRFVSGL